MAMTPENPKEKNFEKDVWPEQETLHPNEREELALRAENAESERDEALMRVDKLYNELEKLKAVKEQAALGPRLYVGTKLILAEPMDAAEFQIQFGDRGLSDFENAPGYKVIYPDGYTSWSPRDVFEAAYREVTGLERELF